MIEQVSSINIKNRQNFSNSKVGATIPFASNSTAPKVGAMPAGSMFVSPVNTVLRTPQEQKMYVEILQAISASSPNQISPLPQKYSQAQKLDNLLKTGKLLSTNSNDNSSTLQNLYQILKTPRINNLNNTKMVNQTINAIFDPTIITQKFGDIPPEVKGLILNNPKTPNEVKQDPSSIDVETSGTCVATSIEFHMANKHPAEFARWANGLSSPNNSVKQKIQPSSLSKNFLDAMWLLDAFKLKTKDFNFNAINLELKPDDEAITSAMVQDNYQDPDERSVIDVLMQSTIMNTGSQKTYNSLTDIRKGDFNSNPQGLIEFEKTFVESIIENSEKLSIVYQNVDENQVLQGYKCDFGTIEKHIKDTIKSGEDVIIGYVLTDEKNQIINGHEITIVDVKTDKKGKSVFVCNDTDDGKNTLVEYSAEYLLPKIHHAGYPARIVEHETNLIYGENAA